MRNTKLWVSFLLATTTLFFPFLLGANSQPLDSSDIQKNQVNQSSNPTCLNRVNIPEADVHWLYIPDNADELYSHFDLLWLAGELIISKVVDASSCPAGGIGSEGYANACGMSLVEPKVVEIQNSFNQTILDAWVSVGVPPVLLKQMIVYESQFWPAFSAPFHYGLGHITPIGMLNALEWDPDLREAACAASGGSCGVDLLTANLMLVKLLAICPSCANGIEMDRARQSVKIMAQAVMGYCNQTAQLVFNATGWRSASVVDYSTIWKLTLMNYNAGSVCVFDTVAATFKDTNGPMSWAEILSHVSSDLCRRGAYYANQVTAQAYIFSP